MDDHSIWARVFVQDLERGDYVTLGPKKMIVRWIEKGPDETMVVFAVDKGNKRQSFVEESMKSYPSDLWIEKYFESLEAYRQFGESKGGRYLYFLKSLGF